MKELSIRIRAASRITQTYGKETTGDQEFSAAPYLCILRFYDSNERKTGVMRIDLVRALDLRSEFVLKDEEPPALLDEVEMSLNRFCRP